MALVMAVMTAVNLILFGVNVGSVPTVLWCLQRVALVG